MNASAVHKTYLAPPLEKCLPAPSSVKMAAKLLKNAQRPLIVVGKGAAYGKAEAAIRQLVSQTNIPFLATPMGNYIFIILGKKIIIIKIRV